MRAKPYITTSVNAMRSLCVMILAALHLFLLGCSKLPESSFELSKDSRLPKWFTLPEGLSRADVTVTMSYYVTPSQRTAKFVLSDNKNQKIAEVTGTLEGMEPHKLQDQRSSYPLFEVVTVDGATEIVEHRQMEPIFYITDDPAVWRELGVIKKKGTHQHA